MNNQTTILRSRIKFTQQRLNSLKNNERVFRKSLIDAKVVNGTSPANLQAGREVFEEHVKQNDISLIVEALIKESKNRKLSKRAFARQMEVRRAKAPRNVSESEQIAL